MIVIAIGATSGYALYKTIKLLSRSPLDHVPYVVSKHEFKIEKPCRGR